MKKLLSFSAIFIMAGVLLWAFPFFSVALSAPTQFDLELVKSDFPDPVIVGNMLTYTLSVTNTGTEMATGVLVTDTLPEGVSFDDGSSGCNLAQTGNVECNLGNISTGESATRWIRVQANPSARGSITNTAVVSSNQMTSTITVTETTTVVADAELGIAKSDGVSEVTAGDGIVYTYAITVTNLGDLLASGVVVTDTWPEGLTRGDVNVPSPGTCNTQSSSTDFTCDLWDIPGGGERAISVTYSVPSNTPAGTQTNTVEASSVDAPVSVTDSDVNTVVTDVNLGISKSDGVSQVMAGDGEVYSYVITVNNTGPSDASSVVVTDTWPVDFERGTVSPSPGGTCDTTSNPPHFTCTFASIPADGSATITANYSVPQGTPEGTQTNTVEADSVDAGAPVMVSDVNSVIIEADLGLTKLDDPDPVHSGEIVTYTLSVTNFGPSDASEVVLTDNLPADTEYIDSLSSEECESGGLHTVICYLETIAAGPDPEVVVIKAQVTRTTPGLVSNQASVTADTFDPNTSNNQASTTTTVDVGFPVVTWVAPVTNDLDYFYVVCRPVCPIVHLEASAIDDGGVQRVYFYRWDHINEEFVDIGSDYTYPYTWEFDTGVLPMGYNQIFARAYDYVGHQSTRKRIILAKLWSVYLPVARR